MNQIAWDFASHGKKVLYLSLEMDVPALQERLFCYVQKVDNIELLKGGFSKNPAITNKWTGFEKLVSEHYLEYCDYIGKTWAEIDKTLQTMKTKPDVLIIDHINEIMSGNRDRRQQIDDYIINLRAMAIRDGFAAILGAQINRAGQNDVNREPQLHQLKESGKLEESADLALLLYWPHKDNEKTPSNLYKINIAKNRNGTTGWLKLNFEPQHYKFSDYVETPEATTSRSYKNIDWGE